MISWDIILLPDIYQTLLYINQWSRKTLQCSLGVKLIYFQYYYTLLELISPSLDYVVYSCYWLLQLLFISNTINRVNVALIIICVRLWRVTVIQSPWLMKEFLKKEFNISCSHYLAIIHNLPHSPTPRLRQSQLQSLITPPLNRYPFS